MANRRRTFSDAERVSHEVWGLGKVCLDPVAEGLIVSAAIVSDPDKPMVYVIWDDDRYPILRVDVDELDVVPGASSAISTGY